MSGPLNAFNRAYPGRVKCLGAFFKTLLKALPERPKGIPWTFLDLTKTGLIKRGNAPVQERFCELESKERKGKTGVHGKERGSFGDEYRL